MHHSTHVFPALSTHPTGQALVSHAGLSVLAGFLNAVGFRQLCEDRFSQFVPATATHRPGNILAALALALSRPPAASKPLTSTSFELRQISSDP